MDTARITDIKSSPSKQYNPNSKYCCIEVFVITKNSLVILQNEDTFFHAWCVKSQRPSGEHSNIKNGCDQFGDCLKNGPLEYDFFCDPYMPRKVSVGSVGSIISNWIPFPFLDLSLFDFLVEPNKFVSHDTTLEAPVNAHVNKGVAENVFMDLNDSQGDAVKALLTNRISAVNGSPGTGKSTTAIGGISTVFSNDPGLIIATAPSNYACDVMYKKLLESNKKYNTGMKVCRMLSKYRERQHKIGDNNDTSSKEDSTMLHDLVQNDPGWNDPDLEDVLEKHKRLGPAYLTRQERKNIKKHQANISRGILRTMDVIVCTVCCASDGRLDNSTILEKGLRRKISALVIDEASLLLVPTVLPLLAFGSERIWLLGDVCQLSPVVTNGSAILSGLGISWMQMLMLTSFMKQKKCFHELDTQYRMSDPIATLVSEYCYGGKVKSSQEVACRLYDISRLLSFPEMVGRNMAWYTYNLGHSAKEEHHGYSYSNEYEIQITMFLLEEIQASGQDMSKVCVLTMYQNQVEELKKMVLFQSPSLSNVEVNTVDSFQGRQEEIVILNFVRSNLQCNVGFLREKNRTNVSISRAKDYLFLVGDLNSIKYCGLPDLEQLLSIQSRQGVFVQRFKFEGKVAKRHEDMIPLKDYMQDFCKNPKTKNN